MSVNFGREISSTLKSKNSKKKVQDCTEGLKERVKDLNAVRRVLIPISDGNHYGVAGIEGIKNGPIIDGFKIW